MALAKCLNAGVYLTKCQEHITYYLQYMCSEAVTTVTLYTIPYVYRHSYRLLEQPLNQQTISLRYGQCSESDFLVCYKAVH